MAFVHSHPLGAQQYRVTSPFGFRVGGQPVLTSDIFGLGQLMRKYLTRLEFHTGTDYVDVHSATGDLHACANGKVVAHGFDRASGNFVKISFDFIDGRKWTGLYAHMVAPSAVKTGDNVKVGQWVGNIGNTGNSFGNHLHFEVLDDLGIKRDPELWLENLRLIAAIRKHEGK